MGTAVNKLFTADGNVYFRLQLGAQHIPHPKHGGMLPGWARCVNRWYICVTVCAKDRTDPSVGRSRVRECGTSGGHAAAH